MMMMMMMTGEINIFNSAIIIIAEKTVFTPRLTNSLRKNALLVNSSLREGAA